MMNYRDADDLYSSLLEQEAGAMFETVRTTSFPQTYSAMFAFCAHTNFLKTAMFDVVESENPYAFRVLYRCFCEHYLKFMYLFVRFAVEKSDAPGREYYSYCGAQEIRQYAAAVVEAESLVGSRVVAELDEFIANHFPDAAHLTAKELKRQSSKFEYRSILKFLSQHPRILGPENQVLAAIVPLYSELSSFVHGGPATLREFRGRSLDDAIQECTRDAELVFVMTGSVLMFTALAVGHEYPEHLKLAANVKAVIKRAQGSQA